MRPPSLFACICIFLIGPFYLGPGPSGGGGQGCCAWPAVFRLSVVGQQVLTTLRIFAYLLTECTV